MESPFMENSEREMLWTGLLTSALRVSFSVIWMIDAALKWQPSFVSNYSGYILNASKGQPQWLSGWFNFWIHLVTPHAHLFAWLTRLLETAIALALFLGFARKLTYIVGFVFMLLVWSTAEGFGGPYTSGATNLGSAIVHALVFLALYAISRIKGTSPYSVDYYLQRRFQWWGRENFHEVPRLSKKAQAAIIIFVIGLTGILIGTLPSALGASSATSENAAKAISPLVAETEIPPEKTRDASLPPVLSNGKTAKIKLEATDDIVMISEGAGYQAWTFNHTVPGPVFHVRQGQVVDVTLTNHGKMQHSIDFHAAEIDPHTAYKSILPGESIHFSFTPQVPGAFLYHCGTQPVLMHMANGMYGAIIVDPENPLPPAAASYVLVQSEWYTQQVGQNLFAVDEDKMESADPKEVVFNGNAFQYKREYLSAHVGDRIRFYVVNAGPNLASAFHLIGGMFDKVYPDGNFSHSWEGVSTFDVAPGAGAIFDVVMKKPGTYPFVDHSMRAMEKGAVGILDVESK